MKKYVCTLLFMFVALVGYSQVETVTFDYKHNNFNGNQPLPAEDNFMIKGIINPNISVVTLAIFKNHNRKDALYATQWRRPIGNHLNSFNMPVDFKLRGNRQYDVVFRFYRTITQSGRAALLNSIRDNLHAYITSIVEIDRKRLSFQSQESDILYNMNQIVQAAFTFYKNTLPKGFPGFSDIVKNKIKQLHNQKITNAKYNVKHDSAISETQIRQRYGEELQRELWQAAVNEVKPYVNGNLVVLADVRERENYPTESISRTLALDVGFGGVYLSGEWDNMDYASAPYAGISFPLGNESISPFWGRTSISLGVFLKNFEDKNGNEITGPIIGLPYYMGLGYKFLHVFRVQAGLVATSTENIDNIQNVTTKDINLQPFIGIGAEINLWLGFDKKK